MSSYIDVFFDKIFYINLSKDVDRNNSILSQFKEYNITNFERVEGVVYEDIPDENLWRNFIKKDSKYIKGALGCRDAMVNVIKLSKERGYRRILILEDDAVILNNPSDILMMNQYNISNADMFYFGGLWEKESRNQLVCAHAYGLTYKLFDDIINMAVPSGMEIDNFYAKIIQHMSYNYNETCKYNIFMLQPFNTIVQNKDFKSNIQNEFFKMRSDEDIISLQTMIDYIGDSKNKTMIEIGSYIGESTKVFADNFKKVICIDPFIDDYDPNDEACKMAKFDAVYNKFVENMKPYNNVVHIKKTSDDAISDIEKVDFIYIDGMHTYDQVKKDILNYINVLNIGGHIAGHDYNTFWSNVLNAVNDTIGNPDMVFNDSSWVKSV